MPVSGSIVLFRQGELRNLRGCRTAKKNPQPCGCGLSSVVVPPGLEPGLFGTKIRRVASYTTGQCWQGPAKLKKKRQPQMICPLADMILCSRKRRKGPGVRTAQERIHQPGPFFRCGYGLRISCSLPMVQYFPGSSHLLISRSLSICHCRMSSRPSSI